MTSITPVLERIAHQYHRTEARDLSDAITTELSSRLWVRLYDNRLEVFCGTDFIQALEQFTR